MGLILSVAYYSRGSLPPLHHLILMAAGPMAWISLSLLVRRRRYRLARSLVAANDGLICWQCWYPLTDVETSRCPECGTPFDREALRLAWTKALYRR